MESLIEQGSNVLWVDFLANQKRLVDPAEQKRLVELAKRSHITHLVVDAKTPYGHTTFPSRYAPHVSVWSDGRYKAWEGRDLLRELIDAAHEADLKVLANIDVFSEGSNTSSDGMAYEKPDWQVLFYNPAEDGGEPSFVQAQYYHEDNLFVNPIHPEVRAHQLGVIDEVATQYDVDGIVLDRCRYPNVFGDFSELSRQGFEAFIGERVEQWPEQIFTVQGKKIQYGKWFARWTEWRAKNIKGFVQEAKSLVKSKRPDCLFSIYVGSWYPLYFQEGVNWGSSTYQPKLEWSSDRYHEAGYADELDFIMTGCYYSDVYIEESKKRGFKDDWYSVEGAINMSAEAVNGQIPFIASLYLNDYRGNPEQFSKAVKLCRQQSHGVMLFDVCYLEMDHLWDILPDILGDK